MRAGKTAIQLTGVIALLFVSGLYFLSDADARQLARAEAYFAGGCFWCVEADFEKLPGVISVVSGYAGGWGKNPGYRNYSSKGHIEAAKIIYNPQKISYGRLLAHFMINIDPTDGGGQFCDRGFSYSTAVFYRTPSEKKQALQAVEETRRILRKKTATRVVRLTRFWKAEEYHQDYYKKNPLRYRYYRRSCGRDARLQDLWQGRKLKIQ